MSRTPPDPSLVRGATVLITGAGHGMGALYARRAAREGAASLALWDRDATAIEQLAAELSAQGVDARAYPVDISQQQQIASAAADTRADLGTPTLLVNNAGIVRGAMFWEHDPERDIEQTMLINSLGPMWLTREFLPDMMADASRPRRILNVASAAGTMPNPRMSVYAASKWALYGWSESLRLELERSGHRHLAVTTFCPSYISTGMFDGARGPLLTPVMTPERAVEKAWRAMLRGTPVVMTPWTVKSASMLRGALPTRAWDLVADRIFQVYSSMDQFTGRRTPERSDRRTAPGIGPS